MVQIRFFMPCTLLLLPHWVAAFGPLPSPASITVTIDSGREHFLYTVPIQDDATAGALLYTVGELMDIDPEYIVLYTQKKAVDSLHRRRYRRNSQRIGCHSFCDDADVLRRAFSALPDGHLVRTPPSPFRFVEATFPTSISFLPSPTCHFPIRKGISSKTP
jgi:hypothetical protein